MTVQATELRAVLTLQDQMSAQLAAAEQAMGRLGVAGGKLGGAMAAIGSVAFTGAVAGVAALGTGLALGVKAAGDLEQSVANISTIKPEIDTSAVFGALNEMQTRVPQSAKELGDALYNVFSSIDVSQAGALKLTEEFAKGAVGAQTDAQTFGTAVLGVMNAYKLSVDDASHVSDVFFNTVKLGIVTGPELAGSLGVVTQAAKAAGVDLDTLGGFIAGVTKEGGPAAQNINNLANFLAKFNTTDAHKAMSKLGVATVDTSGKFRAVPAVLDDLKKALAGLTEAEQLAALQNIFPDLQARQGAQTLLSQLDFVHDAISTNINDSGSAATAFTKMSATFASQSKIFGQTLNSILTTVGAELLPAITPLIAAFAAQLPAAFATARAAAAPFIQTAQDIAGTLQQVASNNWSPDASIDPFVNSLGQVAVVLRDQILPAFGQFFGFLQANAGTIAAVAAGFAAFAVVATIGGAIAGVAASISGAIATITGASSILAGIVAVLGGPVTLAIVGVAAAVGLLSAAWVGNWGDIQGKTAAASGAIQVSLAALGDGLGQIGAAFDAGGISGALDTLGGLLADGLNALAPLAMQALAPVGEAIGGFFSGLGTTVHGALDGVAAGIGGALSALGTVISGAWNGYIALVLAPLGLLQAGVMAIWNALPPDISADLALIATTLASRFAETLAAAIAWGASVLAGLTTAWTTISTTIGTALTGIGTAIGTWVGTTVAQFTAWAADVGAQAVIAGTNILTPIVAKIGEVLSAVETWAGDVAGKISGLAGSALAEATKVGQAIIDGVTGALNAGGAAVGNLLANLARGWIADAKAALGIQSPSTEFYAIGTQVAAGLAQGIGAGGGVVTDAVQAIVKQAIAVGIDPLIALALAKAESDLNPRAVGDNGASVGLFQLHERGQGAGMSVADRMNPEINATKFLSAAHAELFHRLKASGLAGDQLAATFGRIAEGSDPQYAQRYAQAYREVVAQYGNANLAAGQAAQSQAMLTSATQQATDWAKVFADQQAALTQTLQGQAPPLRNSKDAMEAFGAVLGPIERQVAGGAIGLNTLQFKLVDLARATGLATKPWEDYSAGLIDIDTAMERVVNQASGAGPQFDALRQAQTVAGNDTQTTALNFLQAALHYRDAQAAIAAAPAVPAAPGAVTAAAPPKLDTEPIKAVGAAWDAVKAQADAAGLSVTAYQQIVSILDYKQIEAQTEAWNAGTEAVNQFADAAHQIGDYLDSHEFHFKATFDDVPSDYKPGSPSPLENALRGIIDAGKDLNKTRVSPSLAGVGSVLSPAARQGALTGGSGGGGNTINITVNGAGGDPNETARAVRDELIKHSRRNGGKLWD